VPGVAFAPIRRLVTRVARDAPPDATARFALLLDRPGAARTRFVLEEFGRRLTGIEGDSNGELAIDRPFLDALTVFRRSTMDGKRFSGHVRNASVEGREEPLVGGQPVHGQPATIRQTLGAGSEIGLLTGVATQAIAGSGQRATLDWATGVDGTGEGARHGRSASVAARDPASSAA